MVVEAMQLERGNFEEAAEWSGSELLHDGHGPLLYVPTIHGQTVARQGDWVVKGTQAEFYPVTADVFAQIYEATPQPTDIPKDVLTELVETNARLLRQDTP